MVTEALEAQTRKRREDAGRVVTVFTMKPSVSKLCHFASPPRQCRAVASHIFTVALRGPRSSSCPRARRPGGTKASSSSVVPWKGSEGLNHREYLRDRPLHKPVMVEEVLRSLKVEGKGGLFVDGTVGSGGHARAILERGGPSTRLLAIDRDPEALRRASIALKDFSSKVILRKGSYVQVPDFLGDLGTPLAQGVLMDLGASYEQLTSSSRGFSFRGSGPLDMRYDPSDTSLTAAEILNRWSERELKELFKEKGEEPWASRIARAIVRARPIRDTEHLVKVVISAVPLKKGRIHPATRVFQALRIEVNQELVHLEKALRTIPRCLQKGGRLCVITYHSLEDRVVKREFRERTKESSEFRILTPKPIRPGAEEVAANPSARSAKMRVLERVEEGP